MYFIQILMSVLRIRTTVETYVQTLQAPLFVAVPVDMYWEGMVLHVKVGPSIITSESEVTEYLILRLSKLSRVSSNETPKLSSIIVHTCVLLRGR